MSSKTPNFKSKNGAARKWVSYLCSIKRDKQNKGLTEGNL